MFYKKVVLKNFVNLTGKHLCQSLFFNKATTFFNKASACNFIKNKTLAQMFFFEFHEIFKNTSVRLLLEEVGLKFKIHDFRISKLNKHQTMVDTHDTNILPKAKIHIRIPDYILLSFANFK